MIAVDRRSCRDRYMRRVSCRSCLSGRSASFRGRFRGRHMREGTVSLIGLEVVPLVAEFKRGVVTLVSDRKELFLAIMFAGSPLL